MLDASYNSNILQGKGGDTTPAEAHSEFADIDFETRSAADLKKVGAHVYCQHPSTRVLCLAYEIPGQHIKLWIPGDGVYIPLNYDKPNEPLELHPTGMAKPYDLFTWIENGGKVKAHNAEFEWCVWNYILVRDGFPELPIPQLACSAAQAAVMALPRALDKLCDALDTDVKKDMDGKKIMLRLSKLKRPTKKDPECWDEDPLKRRKLFSYCIDDVLSEKSCASALPELTPRAQKFWELTLRTNIKGVYCDRELCRIAYEFAKTYEMDLNNELKIITNLKVPSAKSVQAMLDFLALEGVVLDNLQAPTVDAALTNRTDLSFKAKRVLQIRQLINRSSISKFIKMLEMSGVDGRIRGTLLFSGAATGRDAGRGIQPQNYAKGQGSEVANKVLAVLALNDYETFKMTFPNVFEALTNCLRGMLRAAPGHKFLIADYAGIEARIVCWLAGQMDAVEAFRANVDQYKIMAALIYGIKVEDVTKAQRQLGKQAVLGCGYGMGHVKFKTTCEGYKIEVTAELAKKAVDTYRSKFHAVKALWRAYETAFINAVERPGKVFETNKCKFFMRGNFMHIKLPSGRLLSYYNPSIAEEKGKWGPKKTIYFWGVDSQKGSWGVEKTYGGSLTENICQATAADLLMEAAAKHYVKGYPTVMRVHDELISEVPINDPTKSLKEFENLMLQLPSWALGLPIAVEGFESDRYKK